MVDSKPSVRIWIVVGLSYVTHSGCMFVCGRVVRYTKMGFFASLTHLYSMVVLPKVVHSINVVVSIPEVHI